MDLMGLVNKGRYITDIQLIQNIVDGYHFIDYALVKKYTAGYVDVTLAHKLMTKDVVLTNVEVLNLGSKALSVQHTLVEGDIVMLFSSRAMINDMTDFTAATNQVLDCYNLATIKAIPIAATGKSFNTLTIADDGAYTLEGEAYSVTVGADGTIAIETDKDFNLKATGKINIESTGEVSIKALNATVEATVNLSLKALGSAGWCPNALPACIFSGAPHGGSPMGIIGLKGS